MTKNKSAYESKSRSKARMILFKSGQTEPPPYEWEGLQEE